MSCTAAERSAVRDAGRRCADVPHYVAHTWLRPEEDPTDRWTLELTLDASGVPPVVTGILHEFGLTIRTVQPHGDWYRVVATA